MLARENICAFRPAGRRRAELDCPRHRLGARKGIPNRRGCGPSRAVRTAGQVSGLRCRSVETLCATAHFAVDVFHEGRDESPAVPVERHVDGAWVGRRTSRPLRRSSATWSSGSTLQPKPARTASRYSRLDGIRVRAQRAGGKVELPGEIGWERVVSVKAECGRCLRPHRATRRTHRPRRAGPTGSTSITG
jgi:hypothetical protein